MRSNCDENQVTPVRSRHFPCQSNELVCYESSEEDQSLDIYETTLKLVTPYQENSHQHQSSCVAEDISIDCFMDQSESDDHFNQQSLPEDFGSLQSEGIKSSAGTAARQTKAKKTEEGCRCRNSKCIKMYCECFQTGNVCKDSCRCYDCANRVTSEALRHNAAINLSILADPKAKPCNCRNSHCELLYCQCHRVGKKCTEECNCIECHNLQVEDDYLGSAPSKMRKGIDSNVRLKDILQQKRSSSVKMKPKAQQQTQNIMWLANVK